MGVHPYRRPTAVEVNEYRRKRRNGRHCSWWKDTYEDGVPPPWRCRCRWRRCGAQTETDETLAIRLFCFRFG